MWPCSYSYYMASLINIALGMNFNNGVINTIVGGFNKVESSSSIAASSVVKLGSTLSKLGRIQSFAAVGNLVSSAMGSVKGIADELKKSFDNLSGYAETGDKIAKTSRLVGLSVHDYQAFGSAAKHSGMSIEEMDSALKKFNVNIAKAKSGDVKSLKMFDAILGGKSVSDFNNSTDLIAGIADAYKKLSSAEQKAFVSQELFGKSGQKISELFKDGGDSLKSYVTNYNAAFSEDGAAKAEQFNDSLQDVNETIEVVKVSVAQELFPAFKELFDSVKVFLESSDGEEFKESLKSIGVDIAKIVRRLIPAIVKSVKVIHGLVDSLGPRISLIFGAFVSMVPVIASVGIGLSAVTGVAASTLLPVIGLIVASVMLWGSVIMDVYDNWDMLKSFIVDDVWGAVKQFLSDCVDAVKNWANMFVAEVQWLWNGFVSIFIDPFVNFFQTLPEIVSKAWEGFKNGVASVGKFIYDSFFGSISGAINAAKGLLSSLPLVGGLFSDSSVNASNSVSSADASINASNSVASAAASVIQQSSVTTTNRFAVDFNNVPRGTQITPPEQGDFDWSRSYTFAGAV